MRLRYMNKQWLGAPVFVIEDEPKSRLSEIDVVPAIIVNQSEFDLIEADFNAQETRLRIMLDSFHRMSKQGTLEPLRDGPEGDPE